MAHHHKLIKSLIAEIRELRNQLNGNEGYADDYDYEESYYERKNKSLREENERIHRQIENERRERESIDWEREHLMKEYEKQQRYGDEWSADRTMRKLKSL